MLKTAIDRRRALASLALLAGVDTAFTATPPVRRLRAVTHGVAPYGLRGLNGAPAGLYADLLDAMAKRSGIAIDNVVVPYPRSMAMIASGEADILISIFNSRLLNLARPLAIAFKGEVVVLGRAGSRYASIADLRGKVVAHIRSAEYHPDFHADPLIRKHETSSIDQTVRMLLEGRVDAAVGFRDSLLYTLREMGLPRERLGPSLAIGYCDVSLYLSRRVQDAGVAALLASTMEALREGGTVGDLLKRYFAGLGNG